MSELGIETDSLTIRSCIFLNLYLRDARDNNRINNGKIVHDVYFQSNCPNKTTENLIPPPGSEIYDIRWYRDDAARCWYRPHIMEANMALSQYNKELTTSEFNTVVKEIQFDNGYEFFLFCLKDDKLGKFLNNPSLICDCLYCNQINHFKPLVIYEMEKILITLNNTNDKETLGERKLTKKQIAPINHCIFLVAYYCAIKNKTNLVEIKGESKKHSISPNVNKLNSIEACNENKVESLSGSTFIEGKNNITHNTFYYTDRRCYD